MTREEAIKTWLPIIEDGVKTMPELGEALNMAIKALEQEPFINKPCVSTEACKYDKNKVIDKLRTEIEGMTPTYHNPDWSITDLVPISEVLKLIDKYKEESEETV